MTRLFDTKPFIICEIGSNWRDLRDCIESIGIAKAVGADAVKFQLWSYEDLYGFGPPEGEEKTFIPGEMPIDWLALLKEKADACGIEFMCSVFEPNIVDYVDTFVSVHKVASSDLSYPQLLKAVAKTGKPVILSTGASSKGDVSKAVEFLSEAGARDRLVLMYCAAAYPSRRHNLYLMQELREAFGLPVGLSDHSQDVIYAPLSAARHFGAIAIEKHFTAFPDLDTPDRGHSLTSDEFKIMVDYIRGKRDGGGFNPTSEEKAMFLRHNRRLVATKDVAPGEVLKFGENYGAYRSLEDDAHGLSPFCWLSVEGHRAAKEIKRGKGIGPGDFG